MTVYHCILNDAPKVMWAWTVTHSRLRLRPGNSGLQEGFAMWTSKALWTKPNLLLLMHKEMSYTENKNWFRTQDVNAIDQIISPQCTLPMWACHTVKAHALLFFHLNNETSETYLSLDL